MTLDRATLPHTGRPDVRDVSVWIYGLIDPESGEIRYVGKSANPYGRLASHRSGMAANAVREWLFDLASRGRRPFQVLLYEVQPGDDAALWEGHFIWLHERTGAPLLNAKLPHGTPWTNPHAVAWRETGGHLQTEGRDMLITWLEQRPSWSCMRLARAVGVSLPSAHGWLTGEAIPRWPRRMAVADLTDGDVAPGAWDYARECAPRKTGTDD